MEKRISVGIANLSPNRWADEEILDWEKKLVSIANKILKQAVISLRA